MDTSRWAAFGEYEVRILLLEKELREIGDVRDIATVEIIRNQFGQSFVQFHVTFDTVPEWLRDANLYTDDEGYNRVRAFERDDCWHWCVRRMTIMDIVDFEAIREERLQRGAAA